MKKLTVLLLATASVISVQAYASGASSLPKPYETPSKNKFSKVIGWPEGVTPLAPAGFKVQKFADGLANPRNIYIAPNGDIFVSEANTESKGIKKIANTVTGKSKSQNMGASANQITILRDADKDGIPEVREVFLSGLNQPFGITILNGYFYTANTDGLWRYPYKEGDLKISAAGEKILDLPAGGYNNHWTRNLLNASDGSKIYVAVGSGSNNGENGMEHEVRRANILEIDPDGKNESIYASGLRNPVGMDFAPGSNVLWTAVNERDNLGDDLVPDYLTSVKRDGFYGWPYSYFGANPDPRMKDDPHMELVEKTIVPDVDLGAHTASLGLAFYDGGQFPSRYKNGAFIGQHGSWNRSEFSGYKVAFVPFKNGTPSGKPEDFLTGFIKDKETREVYGRPVSVAVAKDGSLLVSDDAANTIWRVTAE